MFLRFRHVILHVILHIILLGWRSAIGGKFRVPVCSAQKRRPTSVPTRGLKHLLWPALSPPGKAGFPCGEWITWELTGSRPVVWV
jgi:hypothetical protein